MQQKCLPNQALINHSDSLLLKKTNKALYSKLVRRRKIKTDKKKILALALELGQTSFEAMRIILEDSELILTQSRLYVGPATYPSGANAVHNTQIIWEQEITP